VQRLDARPHLHGAQRQLQNRNDGTKEAQTYDSPECIPLQTVPLIFPQPPYSIGPEQRLKHQQAVTEHGEVTADVVEEPRPAVAFRQREDVIEPIGWVCGLEFLEVIL